MKHNLGNKYFFQWHSEIFFSVLYYTVIVMLQPSSLTDLPQVAVQHCPIEQIYAHYNTHSVRLIRNEGGKHVNEQGIVMLIVVRLELF